MLLAIFSVGIALGSALASWLAAGRIILLPTPVGADPDGPVRLDLAWATWRRCRRRREPASAPAFSARGTACASRIDLAGPRDGRRPVHRAVLRRGAGLGRRGQARARHRRRQRAQRRRSWSAGALIVAAAAGAGCRCRRCSLLLGVCNLVVGARHLRAPCRRAPFRDFLSILFRAFYRLEVKGLENVAKAGPNAIIALNHVSFLDAALALSLLDQEPVFAIDHGIAQRWWVKPFLKITRAMPLDPTQAAGDPHADQRGQGRRDA